MPRATALLPDLSPLRRHRSFRLLWFGQLVSNVGTQMRLVALPYQIYLLTGSPFHVGLLGLFQAIPLISLPLLGGVLADRADRRRVLIATPSGLMASSLVLALVTEFGFTELWILYALTAISASFSAFDQPARGALFCRTSSSATNCRQRSRSTRCCIRPPPSSARRSAAS